MNLLTNEIKKQIKKHSDSLPKEEVCGLVFIEKKTYKIHTFPCKNISLESDKHFVIDADDYIKAHARGTLAAYYHSQNDYDFSVLDMQNSDQHDLISIIYAKKEKKFNTYVPSSNYKYLDYLDRCFEYGKYDCFTLLKDFYKKEYNIDVGTFDYNEHWQEENPSLMEDNIENSDFVKMYNSAPSTMEDMIRNDVILVDTNNVGYGSHILIYMGNGCVLHHPYQRMSKFELYSSVLHKKTKKILRHSKFYA